MTLRHYVGLMVMAGILWLSCGGPGPQNYPNRWFYVSNYLKTDADQDSLQALIKQAAGFGWNGMVWAGGLDKLDLAPPEYFRRLADVKRTCDSLRVEIIPAVFSVGYGYSLVNHDPNLAAGLPVEHCVYAAQESAAFFVPDKGAGVNNSGFENYEGNQFNSYWLQDRPGHVSFVDTFTAQAGKTSIRFGNFKKSYKGHGRVMQEINVKRHSLYLVTCWVKTENLEPRGCFQVLTLTRDRRNLAPRQLGVPATSEWVKVELPFNSLGFDKVRIYTGVWKARSGTIWIDDLTVREVGLVNVLRRPGTPVTVSNTKTGLTYAEGQDYEPVTDPGFDFYHFDRPALSLRLKPGSRIKPGDTLAVGFYHPLPLERNQVTICMSEPKVYEIWTEQARLMKQYLDPAAYFLDMDEIRVGGWCQTCQARHLSGAEILGDCITRQCQIIRANTPNAKIYIWSDMLDPSHNAVKNYYLIKGDLTGSWKHVPADLGIMCWYQGLMDKSLRHFSKSGFTTMAAVYYDTDSRKNMEAWLQALRHTPGAAGTMYTTWNNDYSFLKEYGEMASIK